VTACPRPSTRWRWPRPDRSRGQEAAVTSSAALSSAAQRSGSWSHSVLR
jgi:hypothetical protein